MTTEQTLTAKGTRKFQCNGPDKEWSASLAKIARSMGTDREGVALAAVIAAGLPIVLARVGKGSEIADPRKAEPPKAKAPKAKAKAPKAKAPKAPKAEVAK